MMGGILVMEDTRFYRQKEVVAASYLVDRHRRSVLLLVSGGGCGDGMDLLFTLVNFLVGEASFHRTSCFVGRLVKQYLIILYFLDLEANPYSFPYLYQISK